MFTISEGEITFETIESFCKEFGEGVRVEYKQEVKHIPKIVSAFANTQGGIFIIGVKTNANNEVDFPIVGIPFYRGIEEQILSSALEGIYPPIIPEVIIRNVPDNDKNVVVVIRIDESILAPHAIQNQTKIYFRTGSITQPEELSDIDRIAYQLKRREGGDIVIERVLTGFKALSERKININSHHITMIIRPIFPYRPIISLSKIYDLYFRNYMRRVSGGVAFILSNSPHFTAFNEHGIVFLRDQLTLQESKLEYQHNFCADLIDLLMQASRLYESCAYLGNIEIRCEFTNIAESCLKLPQSIIRHPSSEIRCIERDIIISHRCSARDLSNNPSCIKIVSELSRQLFWAYDAPDDLLVSLSSLIENWCRQKRNELPIRRTFGT